MQEQGKEESTTQFDLKKPSAERSSKQQGFMADPTRNATTVVSEILGGIAAASAAAFQALSAKLNEDTSAGLPVSLAEALLDGNARFFDELAVAARHTADLLRSSSQSPATAEIDYERLADLVAERLRNAPPRQRD